MYKPQGEKDARGFYSSFEIGLRSGLPLYNSTPEQRQYNESTTICPECKGYGYRIQRKGREVIRENVGCPTCLGLGKVLKDQSQTGSKGIAA